ncbi:MAG: HdeA/HdeB family chaperone [Cyanobacteria bacterium P01_G01_bin.39]
MNLKLFAFKTAVLFAATTPFLYSATVTASDSNKIKNMSQLTCAEFLDMGMMQKIMSVVWFSGFTSNESERYMFAPDRSLLSNKQDSLEDNCQSNQQDLVMNQIPEWEY